MAIGWQVAPKSLISRVRRYRNFVGPTRVVGANEIPVTPNKIPANTSQRFAFDALLPPMNLYQPSVRRSNAPAREPMASSASQESRVGSFVVASLNFFLSLPDAPLQGRAAPR